MTETTVPPFAETELARLLRERAHAIRDRTPLRALSVSLGYRSPNVLAMYLRGEARVPVDRALVFAQAFGLEPGEVLRAALRQWWSDEPLLEPVLGLIMSPNQRLWLDRIAAVTGEADPALDATALRRCAAVWGREAA